jgi:hypothetical protein
LANEDITPYDTHLIYRDILPRRFCFRARHGDVRPLSQPQGNLPLLPLEEMPREASEKMIAEAGKLKTNHEPH